VIHFVSDAMECNVTDVSCCAVCRSLHDGVVAVTKCFTTSGGSGSDASLFSTGLTGKQHITRKYQSLSLILYVNFPHRLRLYILSLCKFSYLFLRYLYILPTVFAFLLRPVRKSSSRIAAVHVLPFI